MNMFSLKNQKLTERCSFLKTTFFAKASLRRVNCSSCCMQEMRVRSLNQEDTLEKEMAFLPGESHGQRSLAGYSPWGHKESDTTERLNNNCIPSGFCLLRESVAAFSSFFFILQLCVSPLWSFMEAKAFLILHSTENPMSVSWATGSKEDSVSPGTGLEPTSLWDRPAAAVSLDLGTWGLSRQH